MSQKENTETKILEAAQEVFHKKGYDGTRMQEIADTASINKGLLHYYFKTKDKLFEKVLSIAFTQVVRHIGRTLNADLPLFEKIQNFVDGYIQIISRNSYVPRFVINELHRNPDRFVKRFLDSGAQPGFEVFSEQVKAAHEEGTIRKISSDQLMVHMISMCVFPYIARPMIQAMLALDNKAFHQLMEERKREISTFIIAGLRP